MRWSLHRPWHELGSNPTPQVQGPVHAHFALYHQRLDCEGVFGKQNVSPICKLQLVLASMRAVW